jgi:hypothetical protein
MKFGKSILSPSYSRKTDFNSLDSPGKGFKYNSWLLVQLRGWFMKSRSAKKNFKFNCVNCQTVVEIKYETIIGKEFSWHDEFDKKTYKEIKRFYDMNAVGKTPDGGWTVIDKRQCNNCQTQYLIYAGVDEDYNSLYKITLQGITEILEDESAGNRI